MARLASSKEGASDALLESLNFKVDAKFKKAFKGYAVRQGISMVDLLRQGFALTRKHRKAVAMHRKNDA